MFSGWKDMHFLQTIQELHTSKPFYKQVLTDTNGLRKAYVLYRFLQTSVFFEMCMHTNSSFLNYGKIQIHELWYDGYKTRSTLGDN
ncbi:hypothetical protein HanRHA438_Chr04g0169831 [Helianthus annuus]|nr:hypothetical protein HanRHA438_Chr04g0169831 [Helianthus annuus]